MNRSKSVGSLVAAWSLMTMTAAMAATSDYSVVPGHSVGRVWLGAPRATVIKMLGKPSSTSTSSGGLTQDSWMGRKSSRDYNERRFVQVTYRRARVIQIEFNSPSLVSAGGISTRVNLIQLSKKFDLRPRFYSYVERGYNRNYHDDVARGIAFQRGGNDLSWNLKEDPRATPDSIIVHRRGYRVIPEVGGRLTREPKSFAPQPKATQSGIGWRVYNSYFESNQSGLKGRNSYLAFTRQKTFDQIFGAAAVGGNNSFLPDDAFQSGLVVAIIKRGNAFWNYKVEQIYLDKNTLRVRYTATVGSEGGASFASPLIIAVNAKNFDSVVFIENDKKVGEAKVTR